MSKISEQKAFEAYPEHGGKRECYIKGYDQAMQDFLEKAVRFLDEETVLADCKIEQFKNYMQNESEN